MRCAAGCLALLLALACAPGAPAHDPGTPTPDPQPEAKAAMPPDQPPMKSKPPAATTTPARSQHVFPAEHPGAASLPAVRGVADLSAHDGELARVYGMYREVDARMRPSGAPRLVGHVAIELADGTRVSLLPVWDEDALRPEAEVARFRDRAVVVVGTVEKRAPEDPDGGASPLGPCFSDVKALSLAE